MSSTFIVQSNSNTRLFASGFSTFPIFHTKILHSVRLTCQCNGSLLKVTKLIVNSSTLSLTLSYWLCHISISKLLNILSLCKPGFMPTHFQYQILIIQSVSLVYYCGTGSFLRKSNTKFKYYKSGCMPAAFTHFHISNIKLTHFVSLAVYQWLCCISICKMLNLYDFVSLVVY